MAVNFPILYTGKGTTQPLQGESTGFKDLSNRLVDIEKMKLDKALKDEDWLLNQQIDPVRVLSDAATKDQAESVERFNEEVTSMMQNREGPLTMQEKLKVASMKKDLQSKQINWIQGQDAWQKDYNLVAKDFGRNWEPMTMVAATAKFHKTGIYTPGEGLEPVGKSVVSALRSEGRKNRANEYKDEKTGKRILVYGTDEGFRACIQDLMRFDPAIEKTVTNNFDDLDWETKEKYLIDEDEDGKITQEETNNGIVRWAMDNPKYRDAYIQSTEKPAQKSGSAKDGDKEFKKIIYGGSTQSIKPSKPKTMMFGGVKYNNFYSFDTRPIQITFPDETPAIEIITDIYGNITRKPITLSGIQELNVANYSDDTGEVVLKEKKASWGGGGEYIVNIKDVPLSQIGELWIKKDGKNIQLKDIVKQVGEGEEEESGGFDPTKWRQ